MSKYPKYLRVINQTYYYKMKNFNAHTLKNRLKKNDLEGKVSSGLYAEMW